MKSKLFLCFVMVLAAITAFGGGQKDGDTAGQPEMASKEQEGFSWQAFEGTEIRVLLQQHPFSGVVEKMVPGFEVATGIDVVLEVYPENQFREKRKIELMAANDDLDVFFTNIKNEGDLYYESGWYTDLQPFIRNANLTAPDYGFPADYPKTAIVGSQVKGVQVGLPTERAFAALVYYRKDLFEKYGIPTPKTFSDLEEAAKIIYERSNGEIYGIVNRGAGAKATSQFRHALHEFGGKWNDLETGRPTINTPEAIAAFKWWGRTLRLYGPPGVLSYDWQEAMTEFLQGKAAISLEGGLNAGRIEDPEQSKVVGKVGYLPMVSGPGGPKVREYPPVSKVEALAISPYPETKEAAWYFVQWMTGKEAQAEYITTGRPAARESAWKSEQFLENTNRDWAAAFAEASKYSYATPSYAPTSIRDQAQARDIIGAVIVAAINGEDVKAAADKAQAQLIDLWEKEKAASE